MTDFKKVLFRNRGYTPIPLLLVGLIFQEANLMSIIIGFSLAVIGESIRIWCVGYMGKINRTTNPDKSSKLIITGPYALVRNPIYIGNLILYFGISLMTYAFFPYLQIIALFYFGVQYHFIIIAEEEVLAKEFGDVYKRYLENVRRWIPRFKSYYDDEALRPEFKLGRGIKSDARSLQALTLVTILLLILVFWV